MISNVDAAMYRKLTILFLFMVSPLLGDDKAELFPPSTVFYVESNEIGNAVNVVRKHDVIAKLRQLDAFKKATSDPKFAQFQVALAYVESQLDMKWYEAIEALTAGGVAIGFDAETQGVGFLMRARDTESLNSMKATLMRVAREDAERKGEDDPYKITEYRGVTAYGTKDGGFATIDDWFVSSNKAETGKRMIDWILDRPEQNLSVTENFRSAREFAGDGHEAWFYANIKAIRDAGVAEKFYSGKADDFGAELILGGILEAFKSTPHLVATLDAPKDSLELKFSVPMDRSGIPEEREHFFGPNGTGRAYQKPELPGVVGAISVYRDVAQMWLRAGDLFNEKTNDQLAQADGTLSTLFSGKDFGEDILGALEPQLQLVASRQSFSEDRPTPAIQLPAFALKATMKDPATTAQDLRRIFQSLVGFANVVGAQNGQPQLEFDFQDLADGKLVAAYFVPEFGQERDRQAVINYNFAPTLATSSDNLVLATSPTLAKQLVETEAATGDGEDVINTSIEVVAREVAQALSDNREHLIAQNMLKEGHSREEAELQVKTLLGILELMQSLNAELTTTSDALSLSIRLTLSP